MPSVSYTLLILIRNIVAGIDSVSPEIKEAAIGMGYTRRKLFVEIELPLALPVIVAGIRIAAVTVIGLVTVTAIIGQGGLGVVYRAKQLNVGRTVALKMLLAHVMDEEGAIARFRREAPMAPPRASASG